LPPQPQRASPSRFFSLSPKRCGDRAGGRDAGPLERSARVCGTGSMPSRRAPMIAANLQSLIKISSWAPRLSSISFCGASTHRMCPWDDAQYPTCPRVRAEMLLVAEGELQSQIRSVGASGAPGTAPWFLRDGPHATSTSYQPTSRGATSISVQQTTSSSASRGHFDRSRARCCRCVCLCVSGRHGDG